MLRAILLILLLGSPTWADPLTCPDPIVAHDDALEYKTHRTGQLYTIRLQAPDADPGELVSCTVKIGAAVSLTIDSPDPLGCFEEDVSLIEGRHVITRWCTTAAGDTDHPSTDGKFRVPGPKLY